MKTILTLLIFSFFSIAVLAQKPDRALARVKYLFMHVQDTTQKDSPYIENMLLVIGQNASVYTSYDKINQGIARRKQLEEQLKSQAGNANMSINIDNSRQKSVSQLDYFYFAKEQKLIVKERILNNYLVEEPANINWKITKDTANFSGIHCQKAITRFKGRNWIAWFAPSMPFQSGPWKLNGLPGLIIEAHDEKNQASFKFHGIENVPVTIAENNAAPTDQLLKSDSTDPYLGPEIKLPADGIRTSNADLEKLKAARAADPQGFMKTQMAGNATNIVIGASMSSRSSTSTAPKKTINNPLELPEKQ
jgi:GLPGLI family protein